MASLPVVTWHRGHDEWKWRSRYDESPDIVIKTQFSLFFFSLAIYIVSYGHFFLFSFFVIIVLFLVSFFHYFFFILLFSLFYSFFFLCCFFFAILCLFVAQRLFSFFIFRCLLSFSFPWQVKCKWVRHFFYYNYLFTYLKRATSYQLRQCRNSKNISLHKNNKAKYRKHTQHIKKNWKDKKESKDSNATRQLWRDQPAVLTKAWRAMHVCVVWPSR